MPLETLHDSVRKQWEFGRVPSGEAKEALVRTKAGSMSQDTQAMAGQRFERGAAESSGQVIVYQKCLRGAG